MLQFGFNFLLDILGTTNDDLLISVLSTLAVLQNLTEMVKSAGRGLQEIWVEANIPEDGRLHKASKDQQRIKLDLDQSLTEVD